MEKKIIEPKELWNTFPYGFSHGVLVEGKKILFIAGQGGIAKDGKVVSDEFNIQCKVAFEAIASVLKEAGGSFKNIVYIQAFFTNIENLSSYTEISKQYFGNEFPAQVVIEVKRLALPEMKIEIQAIAVL